MPELYAWQQEAVDSFLMSGAEPKGIVAAVTGCGKTFVGLTLIAHYLEKGVNAVVVVPTKRLMEQWREQIEEHILLGQKVSLLGGGNDTKIGFHTSPHITVAVVNTLRKQNFDGMGKMILIADEVHRFASPRNKRIFEQKWSAMLGLSATPERDDINVEEVVGPILMTLTFKEAIEMDIIPPPELHFITTPLSNTEQGEYDDLTRSVAILESRCDAEHGMSPILLSENNPLRKAWAAVCAKRKRVVNQSRSRRTLLAYLLERHKNEKTAVFHESIADIERFAEQHDGFIVHSMRPDGDPQFQEWSESGDGVLFSVNMLKEGIDAPDMDVLIMLSGTNGKRSRIQTIGRAMRGGSTVVYHVFTLGTTDEYSVGHVKDNIGLPKECMLAWTWGAIDAALVEREMEGLPVAFNSVEDDGKPIHCIHCLLKCRNKTSYAHHLPKCEVYNNPTPIVQLKEEKK
mgnify:CR=1 FL=1|tara:strand:+ start:2188 stop:3561 length:1374 start_codon:yes stop_codon:yes gene_type:complete